MITWVHGLIMREKMKMHFLNACKDIDKLRSRSKVYLKSLIRDLDLELVTIIAMSPPPPPPTIKLF